MTELKVHEHGYVRLIETWGSDERIIESARMSTDGAFRGWGTKEKPGDEKLLNHLWTHKHMSPFEMAGAIFEIQAPIFVFREWHRHRTQSYNELSARYTPMPCLHYIPTVERLMVGSDGRNKQAGTIKDAKPLTIEAATEFRNKLVKHFEAEEELYQEALNNGIPKELARGPVSVSRYSRMRASANLRNWLAFASLRCDSTAQLEIQDYANPLTYILAAKFPRTMYLWNRDFVK